MKDKKEKINLIFDVTILEKWGVSGIYNCALALLKQFLADERINLTLYFPIKEILETEEFLKKENIIGNYSYVYNKFVCLFLRLYFKIFKKKQELKKENKKILQFLICFPIEISKPFIKFFNSHYDLSKYDSYFSPEYAVPRLIKRNKKIKKYTLLHDTIPLFLPNYLYNTPHNEYAFINLAKSINSNDFYFCNSDYTKKDFLKYCPKIDDNKTITTYMACDEKFCVKCEDEIIKTKEKYNIPLDKKYVLSLCAVEPRKNLIRTIKTFIAFIKKNNIDDMLFVLGGNRKEFFEVFNREIDELGEYIIKIGFVENEDLPSLYSGAEWFVYTSEYEGFGIPALEAMSCGCPVIASNNTSLPEVVGDTGILVNWDSDIQHIEAYEKYYYDEIFRQECSKNGLARANPFSWDKCSNQMLDIIIKNKHQKEEEKQIITSAKKPKILVVRYNTIGDTIFSIPFYQELRKNYGEDCQIDALADDKNYTILKSCPWIDNVIEISSIAKIKLKNVFKWINALKTYDKIYFLCCENKLLSIFAYFAKIKERIGFDAKVNNYFLTKIVKYDKDIHVTETYLNVLRSENIEIKRTESNNIFEKICLKYSPLIKNKYITIQPFSRFEIKDWNIEKWKKLLEYIVKTYNYEVAILGADKDFDNAMNLCISDKVHNFCGLIMFEQVISTIYHSEFFIGIDSGLVHIASVMNKKSILLHGPTSLTHWKPLNEYCEIVYKNYKCSPCSCLMTESDKCSCKTPKCMEDIEVEDVLNALKKIAN